MFNSDGFDEDALLSLLVAVCGLGILLLVGLLLRTLIPVLKRYFIPAALLGGTLGLILGPHALNLVPVGMHTTWSSFAGVLITVVFAPMLLGQNLPAFREAVKEAGPHVFYGYFSTFAVVGVPALLTYLLFQPLMGTNPLFSTIFEVSWPGGHGTAAGMEESYSSLGWADGSSLSLSSATVGLLFGIVAGMVLLNLAARRGQLASTAAQEPTTGSDILPPAEASTDSTNRLRRGSLDNLAFHVSLIGIAVLIGVLLKWGVDQLITGIPLFPLAMLGGLLVQLIISRTPAYALVDKPTLNSIAGIALDFLVVAAVATISLPVILANWLPLLIATIVVAAISVGIFYWIGPRIFPQHWVENSIVNFGAMTGVTSVGLLLLRAADPEMKTNAFRGFALRAPFASPFVGGGLVTALFPVLVMNIGNLWLGLACLALCLVMIVIARVTGIWRKPAAAGSEAGIIS
jgi:ESS family glutamate:Na+ symporter